MNFNKVTTFCNKIYMKARKVSPELALIGGIACGIAAVVVGCVASNKAHLIVEETHAELDDLQALVEENKIENPKRETFKVYRKMVWKFTKLYAPTAGLTFASIGLILTSHGILNKRYVGISAAYSALDGAFKDYRRRVADLIGDEAEKVLSIGGKVEKDIQVQDSEGNVKTKTGSSIVVQKHKDSPYEFDFNRFTAPNVWEPDADYNEMRLRNAQNYCNELLQARGHLFLNEVLDVLNIKRTPAGAVCGWVKGLGDDYVDFGYEDTFRRDYNIDSDLCVKNIHLNFNCDGPIWELI